MTNPVPNHALSLTNEAGWTLGLLTTVLITAAIALLVNFDVYVQALCGSSALLQAGLLSSMAIVGGLNARVLGLSLKGHGARRPVLIGLAAAVLVALYVAVLDIVLFRSMLSPGYRALFEAPLLSRYLYFMTRAFNENVIYRLFVFTSLALLASRLVKSRHLGTSALIALLALAQAINIGGNVVWLAGEPITLVSLAYDGLRYIVPGVIWGILFVRFGFATAEVASVGCHIFLQPLLGALL